MVLLSSVFPSRWWESCTKEKETGGGELALKEVEVERRQEERGSD